jgi:hypothetical protein
MLYKIGDEIKCKCGCTIRGVVIEVEIDYEAYKVLFEGMPESIRFHNAQKITKLEQVLK